MSNTYLISVKPQWASLFFDLDTPKAVELRKGSFGKVLIPGDRLLIYATLPVGKVLGSVMVCDRRELPIPELRSITEHLAQVSNEDFDDYYQGKNAGVGVWVDRPELFEIAIALEILKSAGVTPPQQITKLTPEQVESLLPTIQEEKPLQPESPIQEVENRPLTRSKPETTNRSVPELMVEIELLTAEIQELYCLDEIPWIIGYSGGKDSTAVVQLIWNAITKLPTEKRVKSINVITTDTLVENPIVSAWVRKSLKQMSAAAVKQNMPFITNLLQPDWKDTFWVGLIGKGYAPPRGKFRWCTDRLKIAPSNNFIRSVIRSSGETILVLGTRKAESTRRAQGMKRMEAQRVRDRLSPNMNLPNSLVYSPIEDWRDDEVWLYLMQWDNPWGYSNKDLFAMYRGASADNECPLVVDTSTPSCGSSRFGCWVCTMVSQDKSLTAMVQNDEEKEWLQPLLDFRVELDVENSRDRRDFRRRKGYVQLYERNMGDGEKSIEPIPGPYTKDARDYLLEKILTVQEEVRVKAPEDMKDITLIAHQELSEIRRIWIEERNEFDDSLPRIYERVTGDAFVDSRLKDERTVLSSEVWDVLQEVCNGDEMQLELLVGLLAETHKQILSPKRANVFKPLEQCFARSGRKKEDAIADAQEKHELSTTEGVEKIKLLMTKPAPESTGNQLSWADIKYQAAADN